MSATQEVGEIFGAGRGGVYHAMLRSPTVLIASIGLWGMNVYFFKLFSIDYIKVLNHDLIKLEEQLDRSEQQQQQQQDQPPSSITSQQQQHQNGRRYRGSSNNNSNRSNTSIVNTSINNSFDNDVTEIETNDLISHTNNGNHNPINTPLDSSLSIDMDDECLVTEIQRINNMNDVESGSNGTGNCCTVSRSRYDNVEITSGRLIGLSIILLILLHGTYTIWMDVFGGGQIGAVLAFYSLVTIVIAFPSILPFQTNWLRISTLLILHRLYELIHPRCLCLNNIQQTIHHYRNNNSNNNMDDEKVNNIITISSKIPRPIPFIDVFFADAMCSLSKVFFDWGMLLHMAMYYPNPVPISMYHILIPSSFAAVPFLIRARQCIVMWYVTSIKNDPSRYQHLWNALKYCTSIFPLCLSAYQKTVMKDRAHELEPILILLLIVNASYALWWDIVMDWGMMKNPTVAATALCSFPSGLSLIGPSYQPVQTRDSSTSSVGEFMRSPVGRNPSNVGIIPIPSSGTSSSSSLSSPLSSTASCWHALLRNRLRFGVGISVLILVTDIILRFSWILRFYHKLFPSGDAFVLCTQFLEVIRRALWNLLRVEWENLKQSGQHQHHIVNASSHTTKPSLNTKQMTPASVSIQMTSLNNNTNNTDEETTSFLRSNVNVGKLTKW